MFIVPKLSSYTHQASGKLNCLQIKCMGGRREDTPIPKFQMCAMLPAFRLSGSVNSLPMADGVSFLSFHPVVASSLMDVWDVSQPWKVELLSISLWINSSKFYKAVGPSQRTSQQLYLHFCSPRWIMFDTTRQDISQSFKRCSKWLLAPILGVTMASLHVLLVVPMYTEHYFVPALAMWGAREWPVL